MNTGVKRNSKSRGLNAVSPLNSSKVRMKFWLTSHCSPDPKKRLAPAPAAATLLGVGSFRASTRVSLIAVIEKKMSWPKIG